MTSIYHGVDVVSLEEFADALKVDDEAPSSRIFSSTELEFHRYDPNRLQRLAGRFAAKEAVLKALKTGFGTGISLTEITVCRENGEPPVVSLEGSALATAKRLGIRQWELSISYGGGIAMASAIALVDDD